MKISQILLYVVVSIVALVATDGAGATINPPNVRVYTNGGSIIGTSKNLGELGCDPATDGSCYLTGAMDNYKKDTITIKVTPPSGKQLKSWGSPLCSDSSNICSMTIQYQDEISDYTPSNRVISLSYSEITDTPAPKPAPTPAPEPAPNPAPTPKPVVKEEDNKPKLNTAKPVSAVMLDGKEFNKEDNLPYKHGSAVVISGKTIPNAEVKLYIFSTPREATVQADENGDWTYSIKDLEPGDHRVETVVVDPETKEESDRVEIATFSMLEPVDEIQTTSAAQPDDSDKGMLQILVSIGVALAVIVAGVLAILYRKKRAKRNQSVVASSVSESSEPQVAPAEQVEGSDEQSNK